MLEQHAARSLFAALVQFIGPVVEETLRDSRAMGQFMGIKLGREPVPDETTVCKLRHQGEPWRPTYQ